MTIASASAYMSRDPAQLVKGSNLAQSGVLGEYLEGLPYRSKSLNMTQDLRAAVDAAMILRLHEVARSHGAGRQRYRLRVPALELRAGRQLAIVGPSGAAPAALRLRAAKRRVARVPRCAAQHRPALRVARRPVRRARAGAGRR
ncbi:hypothetical protein RLJV_23975 [Pseudomonas aeruginosa]|nr:hypothetical protein RLJV_23975 [Pseudomonas aeruginosa]